ncbi:MAG: 2-oxo acid dehydrogenase subunit E2 [Candidatus Porifericomitaceae bacterium WSBS_2022_MAG_OTU9]
MEVKVPALAESISLARILHWHVQPGDKVERGSNLVDIETDKVTLEVPAPQDGVVADILCAEGTDVASGQVIASIEAAGPASGDSAMETPPPQAPPQAAPVEQSAAAATTDATSTMETDPPQAGPAARALLQQHGLKAEDIPASGANGRLLPEDINAWLEGGQQSQETVQSAPPELPSPSPAAQPTPPETASPSPAARPTPPEPASPSPAAQPAPPEPTPSSPAVPPAPPATVAIQPATADNGEGNQRREALSPLRQSIAKRLLKAQHESALLTTFNEIDMSAVMQLRKKHGESFRETHGVKLGYMSFFIRAAIAALRRFPAVGASIATNEIIYHDYYDISIAVGSPRGLVVPSTKQHYPY